MFINTKTLKNSRSYTVQEAIKKLERYCIYQERCYKDVISRLKAMNMIPVAIDTIVLHLVHNDYLNEERYAKSFARGKFSIKKWGRQRIIRALKAKEISNYNINKALGEIDEEAYRAAFNALVKKRLSQIKEKDPLKKKKKLATYLLYRGWESEMVYDMLYALNLPG